MPNRRLKLKAFRVMKGLSQQEMAEELNCSRGRYAGIESGRRDGTHEFWQTLQNTFEISDSEMWGLMKEEE